MSSSSVSQSGPQAFNDVVNAPVNGVQGQQNNAPDGMNIRGEGNVIKVDRSLTDNSNYGTSLDGVKIGNNSTVNVTTSDPQVTIAALNATLAGQVNALKTVDAATAGAFGLGASTIAAFDAMDQRRSQAVSQTINSATDQAREAAARSESIVQNALNKLADQRAPDGANIVKVILAIVATVAVALALRAFGKPRKP